MAGQRWLVRAVFTESHLRRSLLPLGSRSVTQQDAHQHPLPCAIYFLHPQAGTGGHDRDLGEAVVELAALDESVALLYRNEAALTAMLNGLEHEGARVSHSAAEHLHTSTCCHCQPDADSITAHRRSVA